MLDQDCDSEESGHAVLLFVDNRVYVSVHMFVCQQQSALVPLHTAAWPKWRRKRIVRYRKRLIEPLKTSGAVCSLSERIGPIRNSARTKKLGRLGAPSCGNWMRP